MDTAKAENLVRIIAGFKKQGEDDYDYVKEDDAVATVDWIIDEAREARGTDDGHDHERDRILREEERDNFPE
jgi:hypothetical protein